MAGSRIVADRVQQIVEAAVLAPSLHNTQPWRFALAGDALELRADRGRHLIGTDPDERQLVMSCGAALYGARLALRLLGWTDIVALVPDPANPVLLARLRAGHPHEPTEEERRLFRALRVRRTHRTQFDPRPLERGLVVQLQRAAALEGAALHLLEHAGHRRSVAGLVAAAEHAQLAHPQSRREMFEWTPAEHERRRDGIPTSAYPPAQHSNQPEALPIRDFDAGRWRGTAKPAVTPPPPEAAALLTRHDRREDHLVAGMALHRVLLTAAAAGVQASMHSQPIGLGGLRALLREAVPHEGMPQMLLQLGYANAGPPTPRRPVSEVLDRALQPVGQPATTATAAAGRPSRPAARPTGSAPP